MLTEYKALTWAWLIHRQWIIAAKIAKLEGRTWYPMDPYRE